MELIELCDWSKVDSNGTGNLFAAEGIDNIDRDKNLGLFKTKSSNNEISLYSSGYNGLCYATDNNGSIDYKKVIKVVSKFSLSMDDMIIKIVEDEEFEDYLFDGSQQDSDSLEDSELIKFYDRQPLIKMKDTFVSSASILLSIQFILLMKQLCQKPLYKKIDKQEQNLVGKAKGKILVGKNIKYNLSRARKERVYCEFSKAKVDNKPNRILKAALKQASYNISYKCRNNSRAFLRIFQSKAFCEEILQDVAEVQVKRFDFKGLRLSGSYAHYNKVLSLAKLIISNSSIDRFNKDNSTLYAIHPFSINMQKLFECYCRTLFKEKIEELNKINAGKEKKKKKIEFETPIMQPYNTPYKVLKKDLYIQGDLVPDIVLKFNDGSYYVFDVKYKDYSEYSLSTRMDRLQILAYTYYFNASKSGLLFPSLEKLKGKILIEIEQRKNERNYCEIAIPPIPIKKRSECLFICKEVSNTGEIS